MILGHSEMPPLPLDSESRSNAFHIRGDLVTSEVLQLFFPLRCYLDQAICRALAARGEFVRVADALTTYCIVPGKPFRTRIFEGRLQAFGIGGWTDVP